MLFETGAKFVQICSVRWSSVYDRLIALDDDGIVWYFESGLQKWLPMPTERSDGEPIE